MTSRRLPSISVVTVAYNSAATIGDTLASVAAQCEARVEHIVIDGGSTDETLSIVRRHATVAHVISEPDTGIYDAMNKGLRLASGDIVGFLNADDIYAGPLCAATVARAAADADADIVYGDLVYVGLHDDSKVLRYWRSGTFCREQLKLGWMPPHPTFYVTRALASTIGPFDTSLRIAADYDYMLRCLLRPGVVTAYVPEVIVRMRAGGASNRSVKAMLRKSSEDLRVMRRHGVGGLSTLASKNLRKLPQFFAWKASGREPT